MPVDMLVILETYLYSNRMYANIGKQPGMLSRSGKKKIVVADDCCDASHYDCLGDGVFGEIFLSKALYP